MAERCQSSIFWHVYIRSCLKIIITDTSEALCNSSQFISTNSLPSGDLSLVFLISIMYHPNI